MYVGIKYEKHYVLIKLVKQENKRFRVMIVRSEWSAILFSLRGM